MFHRSILFAGALAAFALSLPARAGAPVTVYTAHELSFNLKLVSQDNDSSSGDDRAHKDSVDVKEAFNLCVGSKPLKDQAVFLFTVCSDPNAPAEIIAIDKDPVLDGLESLGTVTFDVGDAVFTERNGDLKTALAPVEIAFSCNSDEERFTATGMIELKFSKLGNMDCPDSGKIKLSGVGFSSSGPGEFLVNDGSSITIKKRSTTISTPPAL